MPWTRGRSPELKGAEIIASCEGVSPANIEARNRGDWKPRMLPPMSKLYTTFEFSAATKLAVERSGSSPKPTVTPPACCYWKTIECRAT